MLKEAIQSGNIDSKGWGGSIIHAGRDEVIKIDGLGDLSGVAFRCSVRETKRSSVGLVEPAVSIIDETQGSILIELTKNQTASLGKGREKVWMTLDAIHDKKLRNFYEGLIVIGPQGSDIEIPPAETPIESLASQVMTAINDFNQSGGASVSGGGLLGSIENGVFSLASARPNDWLIRLWSSDTQTHYQVRGKGEYPTIYAPDRPFCILPAGTKINRLDFTMSSVTIDVSVVEVALMIVSQGTGTPRQFTSNNISTDGLGGGCLFKRKLIIENITTRLKFSESLDLGGFEVPEDANVYAAIRYTGAAVSGTVPAPFTLNLR